MRSLIKKYSAVFLFFTLAILVGSSLDRMIGLNIGLQSASVVSVATANSAEVASGYAWSDTVGWLNFGEGSDEIEGRVYVADNGLYGYAWGENVGWISMTCENDGHCGQSICSGEYPDIMCTDDTGAEFGVTQNNGDGTLTGYAWGENIGWINFNPDGGGVNIDRETGVFSGYAWGENIGWISFAGTNISVTTVWTNPEDSGGSGGNPDCTAYTYSDWSACVDNSQTRSIASRTPSSCSGGLSAVTTQACTVATSTPPTATSTAPATIGISITPDYSEILIGQTVQFLATITGTTTNQGVTWTLTPIAEDDFYGTLSDSGLYRAPTQATGVINVIIIAKAQADLSKQDQATIVVRLPVAATTTPPVATGTPPLSIITPNIPENNPLTNPTSLGVGGDGLLSILKIDEIVVLGTTTEQIIADVRNIIESKSGDLVTKTFTTAGVVGGGIAVSSALVLNGATVADLLFLPFKLWGLLLSFLGLKKRNRPWGTVYDSVTKQPIDPAYVTLKKLGSHEETTSITDLDGRYGFIVSPGKYILTANKTNYIFPSKKLAGKENDELYNNLYLGGKIEVTEASALLRKNIPLDPVKFDWNEFVKGQKKLMKFYSKREKVVRIATDWIFRIGFVVSIVSLFLVTAPYNIVIFGLYLFLTLLRKLGLKQKALGALIDKTGNPLSFAVVRVMAPDLNVEITNKVADKIGRYYCLVPKGKYYVKVEKKNDDESYSLAYTSPVFEAVDGIINKNFTISA